MSSSAFADTNKNCTIDLHINSSITVDHFSQNNYSFLRHYIISELAKKSYVVSEDTEVDNTVLRAEVKAFKRSDIHNPKLKHPFTSLAIRLQVDNQMLFYVHGNGRSFRSARRAYSEKNFKNAIGKAISQLPICN